MKPDPKKFWFPAKRYGWGWGLPCSWPGWVVFAVWLLLICAGAVLLAPNHVGLFVVFAGVLAIALLIICFFKGEKPRWRWGDD
jgi:hypothetical protein